ncbi:MAG: helix-turn-helix transcriptional regulator [Ilumatobacteraceae bacterium]
MAETTARLLGVLSLLQSRPCWTGPELADRFGVTVRTIRRDVDRLRQLGYPIEAGTGLAGGYRLGTGGRAMPPLMLDRDEAVAVAVCLRSTATESLDGGGEAAIRALGKLEQLLPPTLRRQVGTIGSMTERLGTAIAAVSPELLVVITRACRDTERLKVRYSDAGGRESERTLDPYRVVSTARRWYLVAWDRGRQAWRTFRIDRLTDVVCTGHRVELVDPPDPVAFVQSAITTSPYRHQARIELHAPLDQLSAAVPPTVGLLESIDEHTTLLTTGSEHLDSLAFHVLSLDVGFRVREPELLRQRIGDLAQRMLAALTPP